MDKITPFLWFDNEGEEAAQLSTSLFPTSRIVGVTRYGPAGPGPEGTVMTGEEGRCGWLKDSFGLSWQIVPTALPKLIGDPDPERAQRALTAMLGMRKLQIDVLEEAAAGWPSPSRLPRD